MVTIGDHVNGKACYKSGATNDLVYDYLTHIKEAIKSEMANRRLQIHSYRPKLTTYRFVSHYV